jgi:superfamily II DNA/RNA helicase
MPFRGTRCRAPNAPGGRGSLMEAEALSMYTTTMDEGHGEPVQAAEVVPAADVIPAADVPTIGKTFRDFGIAEPICAALEARGVTTAFPIQELTLPIALDGHDLIGQARTGTGKTYAFGVPILERIHEAPRQANAPRALIVVPTRELAIQVAEDLRAAGSQIDANVVTLYGGRAYEPQIEALATVDIVVGTPGRLLDLTRQGHLKLNRVHVLVLDEADKMLDLGFLPDVERILQLTPPGRQTMLFSATMPGEIVTLARRHLSRPMHIRAEQHDAPAHVPTTEQHVFRAHQMDKIEVLARILQAEGRGLTIVFCRTKRSADQVATTLTTKGFSPAAVHGDLGQGQRERAMRAFRSGKVDVLVATDVAARGLDVDDVTHVVNYECPEDEKAYLHRIGRTGRAGREGVAVTFVDWNDLHRWKTINDALHLDFPEPLETYSTSEHLYTGLNIPASVTGVLPRAQRERAGLDAEELEDIGETGKTRSRAGSRDRRGSGGSDHREPGSRDHGARDHSALGQSARGQSAGGQSARGQSARGQSARGQSAGGQSDSEQGSREPGQRSQRSRQRTRSGQPLHEAEASSGPGTGSAAGGSPDSGSRAQATGHASDSGDAAASGRRRPRRRRSGSTKPDTPSASGQAAAE